MLKKTEIRSLFWEDKNQVLTFNGSASNIPDTDLSLNAQHPIPPRYKNFPRLSFLVCKALSSSALENQSVVFDSRASLKTISLS